MEQCVINVRDHGVKGDNSTDDHRALQNVFSNVLPAAGGIVFFPPGTYVSSGQIENDSKPVMVIGSGTGATKIKFTGDSETSVGFYFNQRNYMNTVQVRDLTLTTNQEEKGDAIEITYTPEDCRNVHIWERVVLQNMNIVGEDFTRFGFRNGIVCRYVNSPFLVNIMVSGRQPNAGVENRTHTRACFKFIGGGVVPCEIPTSTALYRCTGINARYGIEVVGAHEGMVVDAGNFIECRIGISQNSGPETGLLQDETSLPDGGTRPGLWISNTHCNVFTAGIYLHKVVQGIISNGLFYKAPDANEDCVGIHLSGCTDFKIQNNIFVSQSHNKAFSGFLASDGTVRCQISNNTFEWCDEGVHLKPETSGVFTWDNLVQGGKPGLYVNEGAENRYRALGENEWIT